jgi:hypothetical protein
MEQERTLLLSDIHDVAFCSLSNISFSQVKRGTRVYWEVPANPETYKILAELREDPLVPILTYIQHLKKLRAMMLDYRDRAGDCGNGKRRMDDEGTTHR